jgi:Flp pilus assembly protein TadG
VKLSTLKKLARDEDGTALLEGAILVPVLCAVIFGVLEFSYYFYQQHLVSTGVRDAARYLARVQDPTSAASQTVAQNLAATGSPDGGTNRRTAGFDPAEVTVSFSFVANATVDGVRPYRQSADPTLPDSLRIINVTGSFTWAPLGFWDFFGFGTKSVTVTHSERWIGQG